MPAIIHQNDLSFNKRSIKKDENNGCRCTGNYVDHCQTHPLSDANDANDAGDTNKNNPIYLSSLQTNEKVELYRIRLNNRECITKCSKIGNDGYVCPRFLREISVLKHLTNPPKHLAKHPGRKNIIKFFDTYTKDNVLHFVMEAANGTLQELKEIFNINIIRERILRDVSRGLQYLHELGYNHGDLSHNNIVYFLKIPVDKFIAMISDPSVLTSGLKLKRIFRFALIDFGNSVHANRPLSLESSTSYAMAPEILNASQLISEIEHIVQSTYVEKDTFEIVCDRIEKLKNNFAHKKSDIWSLGALSFYLHTYDHFAHRDTIEKQANQVAINYAANYLNQLDTAYGKKSTLKKTKQMMNSDHNDRSIIYFDCSKISANDNLSIDCYFDNHSDDESQKIKKAIVQSVFKKYSRDDDNFAKYMDMFANVVNGVAVENKRYFYLNFLDLQSKCDIVEHCYDIKKKYISKILESINVIKLLNNNNKMSIIDTLIIWLISHMYINYTWTVKEIALYFIKAGVVSNKKRKLIIENTTTIAGIILKIIDWNFDNNNEI
jgi:serine/threonine protein kinase